MISVDCSCGKSLRVKDELAGRKVRCPACSHPLSIPAAQAEEVFEEEWDDTPEPEEEPAARPVRSAAKKPKGTKAAKGGKRRSQGLFKLTVKMIFGVLSLLLGVLILGWIGFAFLTGRGELRMLRGLAFPVVLIGVGLAWIKGETFGE